MKKLFIVSNNRKLWIPENKDLFIMDPYIYHVLEKNDELKNFNSIEVCEYRRKTKEDLVDDNNFVDSKYNKYLPILALCLNKINRRDYSLKFWEKALSLALVRYITAFHNTYQSIELYFNIKNHTCNILSEDSYYTPLDFEDHRYCFECTDFGIEQISSIYFSLFYKSEMFNQVNDRFIDIDPHDGLVKSYTLGKDSRIKQLIKKINKLYRSSPSEIYNKIYNMALKRARVDRSKIEVGVCGSFFSDSNFLRLIKSSNARIYPINWHIKNNFSKTKIDWDKRNELSMQQDGFDKFDKLFFTSIKYCFPKAYIENFSLIEESYNKLFSPYKNLKYIVSEAWISNTYLSICLALNQAKGVKHITNEHNCLYHPYSGSIISHITKLSDIFISLGWFDPNIPNMIKGASLFPFTIDRSREEKIKILYISGSSINKISHYHSLFLSGEEGVPKTVKFIASFFDGLSDKTSSEITYRRYPNHTHVSLTFDREYLLKNHLHRIKKYSNIYTPGKIQMIKSSLIIIDYLSTSWLEALLMNIPTIVLWNSETFYLKDEYSDFFSPLLRVGICQDDPVKAAAFVERIKDNPGEWWFSESVSAGRKEFIDKNLGEPQVMIDYLLSLVNHPMF